MRIAVLFDGAGLARLGLEQAGHTCVGFELDPWKHHLSRQVGQGLCQLADVRDLTPDKLAEGFDAVWASPPCQEHSVARTQGAVKKAEFGQGNLLAFTVDLLKEFPGPVWVENVDAPGVREIMSAAGDYDKWNAHQFLLEPIQNRMRLIWGRHRTPHTFRGCRPYVPGVCPCITATEDRGCASDRRRASRFYGRKLAPEECAYHQGFQIPDSWWELPPGWRGTRVQWRNQIYEAIGNGVPVYMAKAFGEAYETT